MAGKKQRSRYGKTRKGKGFAGAKKKAKFSEETLSKESEIAESRPGTSPDQSDVSDSAEEIEQLLSSSRKKMKLHIARDEYSGSSDEERETKLEASAYRLVNLKNLSSVLSNVKMVSK